MKWGVAMEYRNTAVFSGCCGDQRIGQRHAVIPVAMFGQLADCAHRGVGDGAIVAQDPEPVKLNLERDIRRCCERSTGSPSAGSA